MKELFTALWQEFEGIGKILAQKFWGEKDHHLHSSFGSPSAFLSPKGKGFSLTGTNYLDLTNSFQHVMGIGPTGSSKTVSLIVPTLLNADKSGASYVVNDNSGELLHLTGNFFRSLGYHVVSLDFSQSTFTTATQFYNPLAYVKDKGDAAKVVDMLVRQSSSKMEFWELKSKELISLCLDVILTLPSEFRNLANLHFLLQSLAGDLEKVNHLMVQQSEAVFLRYKSFQSNSENTRASIMSSALSCLSFVDTHPTIAFLSSQNSQVFELLRKEKTAVFIRVPVADQSLFAPITNLFWEQLFSTILKTNPPQQGDGTLPLLCIIDELGSTRISKDAFGSYLSNLRKWNCGVLGILQSTEQLVEIYGHHGANIILNNVHKVFFSGLTYESKEISDRLGSYTYVKKEGDHEREQTRVLMTSTEVSTMPSDKVIIFPNIGGLSPLYETIVPYFKQPSLVKKTMTTLPEGETSTPILPHVKLFNINDYRYE